MSRKATMKQIAGDYKRKICVPHCDLQNLLKLEDPVYYTAGTYGWNADIYRVDLDTVIVTGYRAFGNYHPDSEIIQKYDEEAKRIYAEFNWVTDFDDIQSRLRNLIKEFVKEVCGE